MQLKHKKMIAREFLLLCSCLVFSILVLLGSCTYSYYHLSQYRSYVSEWRINSDKKELWERTYTSKVYEQKQFTDQVYFGDVEPVLTNRKLWDKLYHIAKSDSVMYYWEDSWSTETIELIKSIGFQNPKMFQDFILRNVVTETDLKNLDSLYPLKVKIKKLWDFEEYHRLKILTFSDQTNLALITMTLLSGLCFIIRPIIICIVWSLKIIRNTKQ